MSKILLVGKGPPERGGIPSFLELLLRSRLADEHDLRFLNLAGGVPQGGRVSGSNLIRTVRDTWRVWTSARGVDVVHVHSALAPAVTMGRAGLLALAGRLRGARVVVHAHGGRVQLWLTSDRRRLLCRILLAAAGEVVAVSAGGHEALTLARRGRVTLIDNGVDLQMFTPPPTVTAAAAPPNILYVGLLSERKGVLDLLAASDRLTERGIEHRVVLVGGTPDEGEDAGIGVLRAAGERAERVLVAGTRTHDQMPATYHAADVFCLPSWWEAMPLSVLEAMAAGLPVVATEVGDVPRLLAGADGGSAGVVVRPKQPDELADALGALLTDAPRRAELGRRARSRVERAFDAARTIEAIGKLYDASADSRR